jgi:hypothetical protein
LPQEVRARSDAALAVRLKEAGRRLYARCRVPTEAQKGAARFLGEVVRARLEAQAKREAPTHDLVALARFIVDRAPRRLRAPVCITIVEPDSP